MNTTRLFVNLEFEEVKKFKEGCDLFLVFLFGFRKMFWFFNYCAL